MENAASSRQGSGNHRPQIFVHVEFGVSWSQRPPNSHQVTYRSRALRDRAPNFPRQVPPPTTNYLYPSHQQYQGQTNTALEPHYYPQNYPPQEQQQPQWEERRSSRDSRPSHERGRSAPPPINESPWDMMPPEGVVFPSSSTQAAAAPPPGDPRLWKALPAVPSRFRLGEDDLPWSSWSPMGYGPDADPDDLRLASPRAVAPRESPNRAGTAAMQSTARRVLGDDPQRNRELEALSAAMVTVDNGFENQWWNQGPRETMPMPATITPTSPPAPSYQHGRDLSAASVGWAVATPRRDTRQSSGRPMDSLVSPITDYDYWSPPPVYQPRLNRTMSTRSEELFFAGARYA